MSIPKKFNLKHELLLVFAKICAIAVVGLACSVAIYYCTHIYYDREAALHDALTCTQRFLADDKISSWLTNGTLLGAIRLQRFIMWDGEIDIGVLRSTTQGLSSTMGRIESQCFPYSSTMQGTGDDPRRWRLCTRRVCAEIHEFVQVSNELRSIDGSSNVNLTFPLSECTVEGIASQCPGNVTFFLDEAYGPNWRSDSLTSLFF